MSCHINNGTTRIYCLYCIVNSMVSLFRQNHEGFSRFFSLAALNRPDRLFFMLSCKCCNIKVATHDESRCPQQSIRKLFDKQKTTYGVDHQCLVIQNFEQAEAMRVAEGCFDVKCRCCGEGFRIAVSGSGGIVQPRDDESRDQGTSPDMSRLIPLQLRPFVAQHDEPDYVSKRRESDWMAQDEEMFSRDSCDVIVGSLQCISLGIPWVVPPAVS